ncbi:MAG TPA: hypothetical protein VFW00_10715 [Rhodocyclaceae bacterium]|nr:hypothetical protein [Rhodocyclaceae bacterium]
MRRETAYRLAGRKHHEHTSAVDDTLRQREIRFDTRLPDQAERAAESLKRIPGIGIESRGPHTLKISYSVAVHSLEDIEAHLGELGFRFDHSLYNRFARAAVHFFEGTQRRNLIAPQRLLKKSNEVYMKAYEQHTHGDHDDTPVELRDYK